MRLSAVNAASSLGLWLSLWLHQAPVAMAAAAAVISPGGPYPPVVIVDPPPPPEPPVVIVDPPPPRPPCGNKCRDINCPCESSVDCDNMCCAVDTDGKKKCLAGCGPTCISVLCRVGTRCEMKEVQCIRAPCYPVVQCTPISCEALQCAQGEECVMKKDPRSGEKRPVCRPKKNCKD